jgi:hypothetical protein
MTGTIDDVLRQAKEMESDSEVTEGNEEPVDEFTG